MFKQKEIKNSYHYQKSKTSKQSNIDKLHLLAQTLFAENDLENFLIKTKINPNIKNDLGQTALHLASNTTYNILMIEILLKYGAKINSKDNDGWTPLHYAFHLPDLNNIEFLIENGANINSKNNDGCTPIDIIKNSNNFSWSDIKLLLSSINNFSYEERIYNWKKIDDKNKQHDFKNEINDKAFQKQLLTSNYKPRSTKM